MAATKSKHRKLANTPHFIEECYYTTLDAGATVTHSLIGPSGIAPFKVEFIVTERPTSRDPVVCVWDESANSTTNNTIALQFDTIPGGDLTGCEVKVLVHYLAHASGGIS